MEEDGAAPHIGPLAASSLLCFSLSPLPMRPLRAAAAAPDRSCDRDALGGHSGCGAASEPKIFFLEGGIQNGAWCDVLSAHRCLLPLSSSSSSLPTQFLPFTLRQDSLSCALSPA
ncbi:hypothetical protein FQA47_009213 [Oryzias melastigma]|uniref:Uncharacterized protein n=1 Tax=Oryzias melastigma TaxID=30732 RepID=A0A834FLL1_ORYME|nr:hypothetical protein FQA47_009213 [Oryzias melastigma]